MCLIFSLTLIYFSRRGRSDAFLTALSHYLKIVSYSPGDVIMTEGNSGRVLYLIKAGQADRYEKKSKAGTLEEGQVFGEMALFEENHLRECTVKAKTFCEVFTLDGTSLDQVGLLIFTHLMLFLVLINFLFCPRCLFLYMERMLGIIN
jgi:CRP-like cAMP-binding protein